MEQKLRLIMAPLRGVTPATYRKTYKKYFDGITEAMAPFITTIKEKKVNIKLLKDILPENNQNSYSMVPQVLGNNPEDLDPFIERIKEVGFSEINWNLGCPAPMITKKMRGSGLLAHPEKVEAYLKKLASIEDISYSVKVRLGFESPKEILELLPLFEEYNISELIVHPRTGKQLYHGRPDHDVFNEIYQKTTLSLIYNGDIFSVDEGEKVLKRFPNISGIMLGRGILINPFLAAELQGKEIVGNRGEMVASFMRELAENYNDLYRGGDKPVLGKMKELWKYLSLSFPEAKKEVKNIFKAPTLERYYMRVDELFEKHEYQAPTENLDLSLISGLH